MAYRQSVSFTAAQMTAFMALFRLGAQSAIVNKNPRPGYWSAQRWDKLFCVVL
jgi:hypothetical protein